MNRQKVVMVLLIVAILFSLGSIWLSLNADTDRLVPSIGVTQIIVNDPDDDDSANVKFEILPSPTGGSV